MQTLTNLINGHFQIKDFRMENIENSKIYNKGIARYKQKRKLHWHNLACLQPLNPCPIVLECVLHDVVMK